MGVTVSHGRPLLGKVCCPAEVPLSKIPDLSREAGISTVLQPSPTEPPPPPRGHSSVHEVDLFFSLPLIMETQEPAVVSQQAFISARLPDAWISLLRPEKGSDALWAPASSQLEDNLRVVGLWRSLRAFRGSLLS